MVGNAIFPSLLFTSLCRVLLNQLFLKNQKRHGLHDAFSAQEKPLGLPNGSDVPWLGMKLKGYFWMIMCCLSLNSDHSRYGVQVLTAGSS